MNRKKLELAQEKLMNAKIESDSYYKNVTQAEEEVAEVIKEVIKEENMLQNYKWRFFDDRLTSRSPQKKEVDREIQELCDLYPHGSFYLNKDICLHGDDGTIEIIGEIGDLAKFAKKNGLTIELGGLKERKGNLTKTIKEIEKILKIFS